MCSLTLIAVNYGLEEGSVHLKKEEYECYNECELLQELRKT